MIGAAIRSARGGERRGRVFGTGGDEVVLGLDGSGISRRERALTIPVVYSGISRLSGATRSMPMQLKLKAGGELWPTPPGLALERLLCDQPNPEQSAEEMYELATAWMLTRGDAFGWLERDRQRRVVGVWPVPPTRVQVMRDPATRRKVFVVYASSEDPEPIWSGTHQDMIHWRGWGTDPLRGMGVIGAMDALVRHTRMQQEHEAKALRNLDKPSGVLRVPAGVGKTALKSLEAGWKRRAKGGTPILPDGIEFEPVKMTAADAQLLEAKNFTRQDWALVLHLPASMAMTDVGGSMQYSSADMAGRDFVTFAMAQWKSRLEAPLRICRELPWGYTGIGGPRGRLVPEMDTSWFTQADEFTRAKTDALDIKSGARTLREVRRQRGLPTLPDEPAAPSVTPDTPTEEVATDAPTV